MENVTCRKIRNSIHVEEHKRGTAITGRVPNQPPIAKKREQRTIFGRALAHALSKKRNTVRRGFVLARHIITAGRKTACGLTRKRETHREREGGRESGEGNDGNHRPA